MSKVRRRLVWSRGLLLPGELQLDDPSLVDSHLHLEIRRRFLRPMPVRIIRELIEHTASVWVDPGTQRHETILDVLMLGADMAIIDSASSDRDLALALSLSDRVITRLDVRSGLAKIDRQKQRIISRLEHLAKIVQRPMALLTREPGVMEALLESIPRSTLEKFDWCLIPAEGKNVPVPKGFRCTWSIETGGV